MEKTMALDFLGAFFSVCINLVVPQCHSKQWNNGNNGSRSRAGIVLNFMLAVVLNATASICTEETIALLSAVNGKVVFIWKQYQ
jgi:hypothetical protein